MTKALPHSCALTRRPVNCPAARSRKSADALKSCKQKRGHGRGEPDHGHRPLYFGAAIEKRDAQAHADQAENEERRQPYTRVIAFSTHTGR
jgi:hypothetical protein